MYESFCDMRFTHYGRFGKKNQNIKSDMKKLRYAETDMLQKRICRIVGPSLEPLAHRRNVAS